MYIQKFITSLFLLLILSFSNNVKAQDFNTWRAVTSFNTVTDLTVSDDGIVWGVSNGGLFSFENNSFSNTFTTIENMYRLDATVAEYIPSMDLIAIGYIDGMIDLFNPQTENFERLEDIFRSTAFTSKQINKITTNGADMFVATGFGIVRYNTNTFLVTDSYNNLGDFDMGTTVEDIRIYDDKLYAATQQGMGIGDLTQNLNTEDAWINYDENDGLPSGGFSSLEIFDEMIFASGSTQNYIYENGNWTSTDLFGGQVIRSYQLNTTGDLLIAQSDNFLFIVDEDLNVMQSGAETQRINTILYDDGITNQVFAGSLNDGIGYANITELNFNFVTTGGPNVNVFDGISIDDGVLISGTTPNSARVGIIDAARGYHIFRDGSWNSFHQLNNEVLDQTRFNLVFRTTVTDDYYYFGSWGKGVARHHKESDEITVFNAGNSTLEGWVADDPNFPVISGLQTDSDGDVWAVSRFGSTPLYYQRPGDDNWIAYQKSAAISSGDEYVELFLDSNDQKWISLQSAGRSGRGLLIVDTGVSDDASDQQGVKVTDDPGSGNLPNSKVNSIIEDKNGEIWVGTERGIARFLFPQFMITGSAQERNAQWLLNEDEDAESPFLLRDIHVTSMAVNSANQKWVGTVNEGVWLLNEQGSRIIKHYNTNNSPLLTNEIIDIGVSEDTGEVYIATDLGLIIYQDVPSTPVQTMDDLKVFPNPFIYDRHERIIVENLADQTTIRVLGVNGTLINTLENRGGRAEWNGLDYNGNRVGSGVYMVVALGDNGSNRGIGKVVIIR